VEKFGYFSPQQKHSRDVGNNSSHHGKPRLISPANDKGIRTKLKV